MRGSRPRRNRPTLPYRPISRKRFYQESKRQARALGLRAPRVYEMLQALVLRHPQVGSGVIYIGDSCIDSGHEHCCGSCRRAGRKSCEHEHCCMARLMGDRCGKSAHRAKYDLHRSTLVRLHCAGPRMCSCSGCGGDPAGGTILNSNGQPVAAATGYELDSSVLRIQRTNPARPAEAVEYAPPARRQAERLRALKDQLPGRPGP